VARWLSIRSSFVLDLLQRFWQVMADGGFITDAVAVIDTSRRTGRRVLAEAGGVRPRRGRGLKGRCLTFAEREEIALGRAAGESMRSIADRLGRSPPTISRELERFRIRRRMPAEVSAAVRQPAPDTGRGIRDTSDGQRRGPVTFWPAP
jgi:Helix-turn-helix domain